MNKLDYVEYNDGSFGIGEMNANSYITGIGYQYWKSTSHFSMGKFSNSSTKGWTVSNVDADGEKDRIYLTNRNSNVLTDGVALISDNEMLQLVQTSNNKYVGYSFLLFKDGTWTYKNVVDPNRYVYFLYRSEEQKLYMCEWENNEMIWHKAILEDEIKNDYSLPFWHFKHDAKLCSGFSIYEDAVKPMDGISGPAVVFEKSEKLVGFYENNMWNGIRYSDDGKTICLEQMKNNLKDGGWFIVFKDDNSYRYDYYVKDNRSPFTVNFFADTNTIEIKRRSYDNINQHDSIMIDKNFNVTYYEGYDAETHNSINITKLKFDDIYNDFTDHEKQCMEEVDEAEAEQIIASRPLIKPKPLPKAKNSTPNKK